jgi:uncharacterized Zn finger protein (UPF0148 family)
MGSNIPGCATAGCVLVPRIGRKFCDRCERNRAEQQAAADANDPSNLFGARRASLPESIADKPIEGKATTSKKAARAIAPSFATKKHLIHQHIVSCAAHGATRPEISAATGVPINTVNSTCSMLYRQGLIASNPEHERADPVSGNACAVLVSEEYVERWKGKARRERSAWTSIGAVIEAISKALRECDLVHPESGESMSEKDAAKLMGFERL